MRFSTLALSSFALVSAAPYERRDVPNSMKSSNQMMGFQGAMTNHQQVVDTLNRQLKNGDPHGNADRLVAYITGADSQIDNAIATSAAFLAPLTGGLSEAIANVLLGPFVQSVTNGAEVMLANLIGGGEDRVNAELIGRMTGDYSRLAELSVKHNVDASHLQNLNQQIQNHMPK